MKYIARKDEILDILDRYGYVSVDFLSEALHVSQSSIRRDLSAMESRGLVKRSHGGVSAIENKNILTPYSLRIHENSAKKRIICKKAADLVNDGDVVFIDESTTCFFLPELIEAKKDVTVLTNSLRLASLFRSDNVKVYITGGSVRLNDEYVASGPIAENTCRTVHTDIMFFSARAIDESGIVTDLNEAETSVKQVAMQNTDKAVFLCDDSKVGKSSTFKVCNSEELYCIVMNEMPSGDVLKGIKVI